MPASLTAGVCSLCVTASLVVAPPHAAAAEVPAVQHRTVSATDQSYELAALQQQLLIVAGLPFDNAYKAVLAVAALGNVIVGVNGVPALNAALGAIYKGQWNLVPQYVANAFELGGAAVKNLIDLPRQLITYDVAQIGKLFGGASALSASSKTVSTAAAVPSVTAAVPSGVQQLLVVAGLPFDNAYKAVQAVAALGNVIIGVTGVPALNAALGAIYKGQWNLVPGYLANAFELGVAAVKNLIDLPRQLIAYDVAQIGKLFSPASATSTAATFVQSERVATLALPTAKTSIEAGTPTSADEVTDTKKDTKDATEVKDTTETKDTTEVKDSTETKDATDTKDTTTEVKDPTEVKDTTTETKDATETKTPADTKDATDTKDSTESKDTTGDKTGEKDAKDSTTTKKAKKGSTYGKHARQDDGTDSTASASTGTKTSTGGKHRKPEGGSSEGSSASSAGEHSSAA
jgi:hypothetical protein